MSFSYPIDEFAARFAAAAVPKADWTHEAHLAVGLWHVHHFGPNDALQRLRDRIRCLNDFHGTINSATSGYHETITCAYVRLIQEFLAQESSNQPLQTRVDTLLASPLAKREALFTFYTRDRLMSPAARADWIEPDIRPLSYRVFSQGVMHLVMFDVDGTLVDSMGVEGVCFPLACETALGISKVSNDWSVYKSPSDGGIVAELVQDRLRRQHTVDDLMRVEACFVQLLIERFNEEPGLFAPIPGALAVFSQLQQRDDVQLAVATGGWGRTAQFKLSAAGFKVGNAPFASANDAVGKAEIMRVCLERARAQSGVPQFASVTYVGDLPGDAQAASDLKFNFIGVGDAHEPVVSSFQDFTEQDRFFLLLSALQSMQSV